ncbi:amidohydrolase family protein [Desulfosediminicola flagellatus]|uniref:amidohydrolase family protein n=1 Tax=Desulfosediminicola flagellatus TaxID=2569541 RepID=UPI0010ACD616|nr:amidohydrolase family protein [Desulfosediminicola flagellatus]
MTGISYIRAGWLIDGSGGPILRDVVMTITEGSITHIEKYSEQIVQHRKLTADFSFGAVMPPFIDSHVHLAMSGSMDQQTRENQLVAGCEELEPYIETHLEQLFNHGVLTVRDGGDRDNCVHTYLNRAASLKFPVQVITPGRAWHRKGRYGGLIGRCPAQGETLAEAYLREEGHTSFIKLVNSGLNSLKNYGKETAPQFNAEEIRMLVREAEKDGRKVMVHANGKLPVQEAVEAGCHSIEHGFFMGRENLELMARKGCFWVPTVCTMKAYAEILSYQGNVNGEVVARKNLQHQLDQLRLAREIGVKVVLGTDSGSPGVLHGEGVFEEMKLFTKAGYSLEEIVQSATSLGAELLGITEAGLLQKGRPADFLVTRGTPAQLPRKFSYLESIYLAGKPSEIYLKNPMKHVQGTD